MALKYTRHGQTKPSTDDGDTMGEEIITQHSGQTKQSTGGSHTRREEIYKLETEIQKIKNTEWMVWALFLGGFVLLIVGIGLIMIILAILWNWDRSNKIKELTSKKERYEDMLMRR